MNTRRVLMMAALLGLVVTPAWGQGTLFVEGDKVGIGNATPNAGLHVLDTGSGVQNTLQLQATGTNGRPRFIFANPSGVWYYEANGPRFEIHRSGSGSPAELKLDPNGDLTIAGTLTELSSRAAKEGFVELDPAAVLSRLAELPVLQWSYTADEQKALHIGPMAEDFYEAFGLGADNKHIAPSDKVGVALVAIQGLRQQVQDLTDEKAALEERLSKLEQLLE